MRNAIPPFQIPAPLQTLYDAAAAMGPQFGLSPEAVFGDCGLRLEIPPVPGYIDWCTPRNVMTFATTGCDSVHYSYLVDERLPHRHDTALRERIELGDCRELSGVL